MKTITPVQMRDLEQVLFKSTPMTPGLLMEKAAVEVVCQVKKNWGLTKVLFLCGPGNNGGDGFAAARLYKTDGGEPVVWKVGGQHRSKQCIEQEELLAALWPEVSIEELPLTAIGEKLKGHNLIVDALFGTGLSKPLGNDLIKVIDEVNQCAIPVIAVDIPTGVEGAWGRAMSSYIKASTTIAFHRPKRGFYFNQGINAVGEIIIRPIGIPQRLDEVEGIHLLNQEDILPLIQRRRPNSHKGDYGKLLIIAGSLGMAGAAVFAARGALCSGAGLVTVACPKNIVPIIQGAVPEAMCLPLEADDEEAVKQIEAFLPGCNGVVFGPGWGRQGNWQKLTGFLSGLLMPVIWDADGLFHLKQHHNTPLGANHILTPHPGEGAILLDQQVEDILAQPDQMAIKLHAVYGGSILLKGARSLLYSEDRFVLNTTGSPALAKGGSGDVLSGILGAFGANQALCPKPSPLEVMCAACYLHGLAGEAAGKAKGEASALTSNVVEELAGVIQSLTALNQ